MPAGHVVDRLLAKRTGANPAGAPHAPASHEGTAVSGADASNTPASLASTEPSGDVTTSGMSSAHAAATAAAISDVTPIATTRRPTR